LTPWSQAWRGRQVEPFFSSASLRLFRRLRFSQPEARSSARGAVGISSGSRDGMDGELLMCCEDQNR